MTKNPWNESYIFLLDNKFYKVLDIVTKSYYNKYIK